MALHGRVASGKTFIGAKTGLIACDTAGVEDNKGALRSGIFFSSLSLIQAHGVPGTLLPNAVFIRARLPSSTTPMLVLALGTLKDPSASIQSTTLGLTSPLLVVILMTRTKQLLTTLLMTRTQQLLTTLPL